MNRNPKSTMTLGGHPIHPMLVPFPITFFVSTLVCDIAYWSTNLEIWATASIWLLGSGLLSAAAAAIVGSIDFFGDRRIREIRDAHMHAGANVVVVLIQLYNFYIRYDDGAAAILPVGIVLSLLAAGLLLFSGRKGGALVYAHRVGVHDHPEGEVPPRAVDATRTFNPAVTTSALAGQPTNAPRR